MNPRVPLGSNAPTDDVPELLELRTGAIAAGGGCVARHADGRVVFVRHSLPGEVVRATVTAKNSSYLRADAVEILQSAGERVLAPCRYAGPGLCGGCDWQHISLPAQRSLKAVLVSEQLRRLAGIDQVVTVEEVAGRADGLAWRSRTRFAVTANGSIGFRRHRSHEIELIDCCLIASSTVESAGVEGLRWPGASDVEVFAPEQPEIDGRVEPSHGLVNVAAGRKGIRPSELPALDGSWGLVVEGQVLRPPDVLHIEVLGSTFQISAGVFWQVHEAAPTALVNAVLEGLAPSDGQHVLDLFSGVGLFSVHLGRAVGPTGSVIGIERDRRSCSDARHNTRHQQQVKIRRASVTAELISEYEDVDLVVLDPPREGAGRATMASFLRPSARQQRIAYVSCDPATFSRDVRVLLDADWTMPSLRAFDLFPMTEHVEIVAILEPPQKT